MKDSSAAQLPRQPNVVRLQSICGRHHAEIIGAEDLSDVPWVQSFLRRPGFKRFVVDREDSHLISAEYEQGQELFVGRIDQPIPLPKGEL